MRKRLVAVLTVSLVLFGGVGVLLSQGAPDADGFPDISGSWVGKAKVKESDLTGDDEGGRESVPVGVSINQRGAVIVVTIDPPDGDPIVLEGLIGDGHLWAAATSEFEAVMMVGHVKKKGKQIKAVLLSGEDDSLSEVKVTLKRPK